MSVKRVLIAASFLLLLSSCMMEAGEDLGFPDYLQASTSLPGEITIQPVFSTLGNYGIVASGDTLYHLELRHGRIHGKTDLGDQVAGLARNSSGDVFAVAGNRLCAIEGFEIIREVTLSSECIFLTACGNDPVLLMADGRLVRRSSSDLSAIEETIPDLSGITAIHGFPGYLSMAGENGTLVSLAVPGFKQAALETVNGNILFMNGAGSQNLLFSTDQWNEVAACNPADLQIQIMFTFPEAPVFAAADSSLSFVYGVSPSQGVCVCSASGEIQWRSSEFGADALASLADDCETALLTTGKRVDVMVK